MAGAVASVVVASASAVAKVFVIGTIGYASAKRPRPVPLLPPHAMTAVSKMNFNLASVSHESAERLFSQRRRRTTILTDTCSSSSSRQLILPLVYSTMASAVTPARLGSLWFVVASAFGVICLSYGVATALERLPCFRVANRTDFDALRIAAAFPNIVALPILIFPTLCEFPVVHDAFHEGGRDTGATEAEKYKGCVDRSNAMIFVYFFAWNLLYWILGFPTLVAAGRRRQEDGRNEDEGRSLSTTEPHLLPADASDGADPEVEIRAARDAFEDEDASSPSSGPERTSSGEASPDRPANGEAKDARGGRREARKRSVVRSFARLFANALLQTLKSPGFVAMALGFVTACVAPLREALFDPGGALRFLGSALESLGAASSSVGTLLVAASLAHDGPSSAAEDAAEGDEGGSVAVVDRSPPSSSRRGDDPPRASTDLRASLQRRRTSLSRMSSKALSAMRRRKPTIRMHAWFVASRLIVAPALVGAALTAMDCGGVLDDVPNIAKMVVMVNAGLPGAQLIILTLKSKGLSDSASVVAEVYIPCYLLSVVTIAGWATLGLVIAVPREDGTSFCER